MGLFASRKNVSDLQSFDLKIKTIMDFRIELTAPFFTLLQNKMGIGDELVKKLWLEIPKRIEFKIEFYNDEFNRMKIWKHWRENQWRDNVQFLEYDETKLSNCNIWRFHFDEYLPNPLEAGWVELEFLKTPFSGGTIFPERDPEIILYLHGGKFGSKFQNVPAPDNMEPLDKNIIFRIPTNYFQALDKYHWGHPQQNSLNKSSYDFRAYKFDDKELDENGCFWHLRWFDFTGQMLPKLGN